MEAQRYDYGRKSHSAIRGMLEIEQYVRQSGLDMKIFELVKYRASQINGCAYCMDMHTKDARVAGESEQRLYLISAWRESPCYTDKEKAALAWTEALTLISENNVPDELYQEVRKSFKDDELMALTMAVVAINGWNRLSIAFRTPAGSYKPQEASS